MNSPYTIREARSSDLDALIAFTVQEARETEGVAPDLQAVRRGVRAGVDGSAPSTYWVAESQDGNLVGSISVTTEWSNFRGGTYWWIQSLFIVPEHRGSGLVDLLLGFVAGEARAAGALDLRLYALRSNQRALAAYRRFGFVEAPYTIMARRLDDS
jgi:ribosomal protein S18 acetylase RimI-like enzyme